jgi:hypothetical protein
MATKKFTDLTQATQAEVTDAALVALAIDPSGTPASRKTSLARAGALPKSWLDSLALQSAFGSNSAGSFTTGVRFGARRASQKCNGLRFYWNHATPYTIKCSLWKGGAGIQATANVSVSGAGYYSAAWSEVAITGSEDWYVTIWENSGTRYQLHQDASSRIPARPLWLRDYCLFAAADYAAGDAEPNTSFSATDSYPVEPLLVG